jgi:catechol 2,3-dioxygenase-like lactoylglutathione lyase family enzyme
VEQRLSLVTLGVADLARSRRFYEDGLGWQRNNDSPDVAFYQMPGTIIALWSRKQLADDARLADSGASFSGMALAYNARDRDEVDAVLAQAADAGAIILKPAEEAFWGGYSGYFADPDGHPWEVAWNPFWRLDDDGRVTMSAVTTRS